ncbi:hypothetical protein AOLI_G00173020 [Acnodon oligacanthus]
MNDSALLNMKLSVEINTQNLLTELIHHELNLHSGNEEGATLRIVDFSFSCKCYFCSFPSLGCCGDHQKEAGDCHGNERWASSTFILKVSTMVPILRYYESVSVAEHISVAHSLLCMFIWEKDGIL